ncbi:hypothetical protein HFN60_30325 [Rhizobium leguminosarum]|uniref:hypothetical protein n=1 Tax=Rhizobium leguminosarum TaxID=384 RepID=UPI001C95103D|nr:hypothetical protein [Rhizobium leguminosarum]MBY5819890.1 hypothetical protein [Rhizobium leguminosarum]
MQTIKKFTYPTFMGVCSILAAFADILQNQNIFVGMLITLICLGALALIVPPGWVSEKLADTFGVDPSIKQALRPFGLSCFILGAMIYTFSAMSTEASDKGGALVATFPELKQVQLALGRIEQDVGELKQQTVAIKQDTEQLVETAVKWISIDVSLNSTMVAKDAGEKHFAPGSFYVNFANETGQTFEDVALVVTDGSKELISETVKILPQDGYKHNFHDGRPHEKITVCLTAKRKDRAEWVQENRVYEVKQARPTDEPQFELSDATGQKVVQGKPSCSV